MNAPNRPGVFTGQGQTSTMSQSGQGFQTQQTQSPNMNAGGPQSQAEEGQAGDSEERQKLSKSERRDFLIKEMKKRIDLYFNINVKQVGDMIPKIIQTFLINEVLVR